MLKRFYLFSVCMGLMIVLAACGTANPTQSSSPASAESSSDTTSSLNMETSQGYPEQTSSDAGSESQTNRNPTNPTQSSLPSESMSSQEALENGSDPESSPDRETSQEKPGQTNSVAGQEPETGLEETDVKLKVEVNGTTFTATLEDNAAVDAFVEMMREAPVVIQMSDYSGFEKVGPLGTSLPTSNSQTTTQAGDIVLYNGNQIVIFYGSNSWSYTRLGKIDDLTGWEEALGRGDVTVTFSIGG